LRDAIRRAGGVPLARGFITQEALIMIGEELQAIADAGRMDETRESLHLSLKLAKKHDYL
jgi:hypothetical protein